VLLGRCRLAAADIISGGTADTEPGYNNHTLFRDDVHTVAVPIFANRTYIQGAEFRLTKAVIEQIEGQSPYKIVPKERADTILEGEITGNRVVTQSNSRSSAVPMEQMYVFVVRFTWRDLRTGKILKRRESFEQTAPYYPTLGEDRFVAEQQKPRAAGSGDCAGVGRAEWGEKESQPK